MNKIFCIIGKTSSGKNRLYQELLSDESLHLKPNVMYTTRPIRENEQEGKDYHFVNQIFFEKAKEENRVVESRNYETVYGPWTYFTLADEFDLENYDYLVINTLEGYQSLKKVYGNKVVPLYLYVDDFLRLERALYFCI